jgi:hypothetical protein
MTKLSTNTKELRSFGLVLFGASVVLNTYFWWNDDYLVWLSIAGSSLALMAVLSPLLLSPFHWIWYRNGNRNDYANFDSHLHRYGHADRIDFAHLQKRYFESKT